MAHALCFYALSPPKKLWEFCIQRNLMNKTVLAHGIDDSNTDALAKMPSYDLYYFLPKMFLITFSQIFIPLTIDCFVSHLIINFLIISHGTMILCLLGLMSFQLNGLVIFIYFLLFPCLIKYIQNLSDSVNEVFYYLLFLAF